MTTEPLYKSSERPGEAHDVIELLRRQAERRPDRKAFTFLADGETEEGSLTYGELLQRVQLVGGWLQSSGLTGERVLLLYRSGLDYIVSFLGCLYAGAVAVPSYPPQLNRPPDRLEDILANAQPAAALTTTAVLSHIKPLFARVHFLAELRWLNTDEVETDSASRYAPADIKGDTLAFLQYTSGSIGTPRGVMVTHANLLHNERLIQESFRQDEDSIIVSWLPLYHDMGLIGGILQPLYLGARCILMSPLAFLQRPVRWLRAISHYKATTSGGPNFAYDLCVRKIDNDQRAQLDLSSWTVAFNGSEPIRAETLSRFSNAYKDCGFNPEAFTPCYGLAEATLMVSGGLKSGLPMIKTVRTDRLEKNLVVEAEASDKSSRPVVSCGGYVREQKIELVDTKSQTRCMQGEVGEVWVSGPSVAQGYWNNDDETERTFGAYTADSREGPFLRTGDLGFIQDGELFITGRLKDLIIIRGANHYPADIEFTIQQCSPMLRPGCGAAFSIDVDGEERLVVVQEVEHSRQKEFGPLFEDVRRAVALHYELELYCMALIKPGSLPKTSSGKIRRGACRDAYLSGSLKPVAEWKAAATEPDFDARELPKDRASVETWIKNRLAANLGLAPSSVDARAPIAQFGFDSLKAVELMHQIEVAFGVNLSMASLLKSSSISDLVAEVLTAFESGGGDQRFLLTASGSDEKEFQLSHNQQSIWYMYNLAPDSSAYNIATAVRLHGRVETLLLSDAFQKLVDRHPSLRTTFNIRDGKPVQKLNDRMEAHFKLEDASDRGESWLEARLSEESNRPFDLESGPLMRVSLFKLTDKEHVLLLVIHHIVADFWSIEALVQELRVLYESQKSNAAPSLPRLTFNYFDYVRWQKELLSRQEGERLYAYWERQLAGELPVLNLMTDRPRPSAQTFRGATHTVRIDAGLTEKLRAISQNHDATLFMTLLAAFQVLLHRYTRQDDILVGSTTSGRRWAELSGVVGYFVNPIVLRGDLSNDPAFSSFLRQVRRTVLDGFEHQDYPFALIVERLQPMRDLSRSPIFQAMFTYHKAHLLKEADLASFASGSEGAAIKFGDLLVGPFPLKQQVAQFDLTLMIGELEAELTASLQYNTDIFDAQTISRMADHFCTLLGGIVADPQARLSSLPMLTGGEREQLLIDWNDTSTDYPRDRCIHEFFEAQVERTPESIAVMFEDESLTYRELNEQANRLGNRLRSLGIGPESLVGVCAERSLKMIVGLLGILKAGAAYVPLDPSYPKQRLAFMLGDAGISALLTQQHLLDLLPEQTGHIICLDTDWEIISRESSDKPASGVTAENLAYVIYTSGSTGTPKGVMVSHRNVANFFTAMDRSLGGEPPSTWLAVTSISFDISVLELLWTLTTGAQVIIRQEPEERSYNVASESKAAQAKTDFSLFYFASEDNQPGGEKYRLLIEGAKFADGHGFHAVWTPERHFHAFGGLFPNPSVISAALAMITERIAIRAGSVVLPLHNPIRVAEEWSIVDNLSNGRVGLSFASGWHADDFTLAPDNYGARKEIMLAQIETIRELWRGNSVRRKGGLGSDVEVKIWPRPVQHEVPFWLTAAGSPETFRIAGEVGANLLTHLLGQSIEELSGKIEVYREAYKSSGHPGEGRVTLMIHTFVGMDENYVREKVRGPFTNYLMSSLDLMKNLARGLGYDMSSSSFTEDDKQALLSHAFDRYFETSGLFGTPSACLRVVDHLRGIGVDEIACLVDFGVDTDSVIASLELLNAVRECSDRSARSATYYSLPAEIARRGVTHMQCTPSLARMLAAEPGALDAMQSLSHLLLGGEALPAPLVKQLREAIPAEIHNMYGPTETTIWSATCKLSGSGNTVPIGKPIANNEIYILDPDLRLAPVGVPGELFIGGEGVVRGYLDRASLTAERFLPNPFTSEPGGRMYRTGDLARYQPDGNIEFLGRLDAQIKLRGQRIELGEIEAALEQHADVKEAVVIARENSRGDSHLVAYVVPSRPALASRYQLTPVKSEEFLKGLPCSRLPNGLIVAHHGGLQTSIIYREIFEAEVYLKHGISISEGDCIFDVGANIGLFSLYASRQAPDVEVYAFEPLAPNYDLLRANVEMYGLGVKTFNYGLSSREESAEFAFYPAAAGLSGRVSNSSEDKQMTRSIVLDWLERAAPVDGQSILPQGELQEIIDERLQSQIYTCRLRRLSDVISENNIERIDLLKIDVEGSELDVLAGIQEPDLPKIKQIVMEVHGKDLLSRVGDWLKQHGYEVAVNQDVAVEEEAERAGAFVYTLYAIHHTKSRQAVAAAAASNGASLSISELQKGLKDKLPDYMIPSKFILLGALPLTPNGKVDRRALATIHQIEPAATTEPARTPIEKSLAEIWMEILDLDQVGVQDNFFEVGGHSLAATQLVSRVRLSFGSDLTLRGFLNSPTIKSLAEFIEEGILVKADSDRLDRLLEYVEGLNEEEAETLLSAAERSNGQFKVDVPDATLHVDSKATPLSTRSKLAHL